MSSRKVLVVEDEALLAMTLEDWLQDLGYDVIGPAMTLKTAAELAEAGGIDAAILDINIGGEWSYGIAGMLAERGVPYAFATGYGAAAEEVSAPGVPVLHKPYHREELGRIVARLLG